MIETKTLVNFYVPHSLKERFDHICSKSGRSRSSALIECMKRHVIEQSEKLTEEESALREVDDQIAQGRKVMTFKEFLKRLDESKSESRSDFPLDIFFDDGSDPTSLND